MKNMFYKVNFYLGNIIFLLICIMFSFLLYLFDIRLRMNTIIILIFLAILGLIFGGYQKITSAFNKKVVVYQLGISFCLFFLFLLLLMPFISRYSLFQVGREYVAMIDGRKYVGVLYDGFYEDIDFYEYYGLFLMGTEVKVHGYFKGNSVNPFLDSKELKTIEYTYYDDEGISLIQDITLFRDDQGTIVDWDISEEDFKEEDIKTESENYVLPEEEEVLYEKAFGNTILRFGLVDYVLGGNMLVNVVRSPDNGENFYVVSTEVIQVSNEAKFVFLDENLGFALSNGEVILRDNRGLFVTNDGGKTFRNAHFHYVGSVSVLTIEGVPFIDDDKLMLKAYAYQISEDKTGYENKELLFVSEDQGFTWNVQN